MEISNEKEINFRFFVEKFDIERVVYQHQRNINRAVRHLSTRASIQGKKQCFLYMKTRSAYAFFFDIYNKLGGNSSS